MLLIRTRSGFEIIADPTRTLGRRFTYDLIGFLRDKRIDFQIGGQDRGVIMTIDEASDQVCEEVASWWNARA